MLLAKTDDAVLLSILQRLDLYIHYIVEKMYHDYGAKFDSSISKDDLYASCVANIVTSIRLYYHPEKYNIKKDKHNCYRNGFTYVVAITRKFIKSYWRYIHRKKRIPPQLITSIEAHVDSEETVSFEEILGSDDTMGSEVLSFILDYYKMHNKRIKKLWLYDLVCDIILRHLNADKIAKKYHMKPNDVKDIIKKYIVCSIRR
jgi:hypothetical protein